MTVKSKSVDVRKICERVPVIPALVVGDINHGRPLAEALIAGGLPVLEVTLRTPAALDVIRAMNDIPNCLVGAGTLITAHDVRAAKEAGAKFGVSPGATEELIAACENENLPLMPGAATISEAMFLSERGYDLLKFFPAHAAGGLPALKSISAALPRISFCPNGGISMINAKDYLSLNSVVCVGGNWVAPANIIQDANWNEIKSLAKAASSLAI